MAYDRQKVIKVAQAEVGYLEKKSNSSLYSTTANAGSGNYTKYAKDLYDAGYYNGNKNGFYWCDVFVDWCFYTAYGKKTGQALQCQTGDLGAGCKWSAQYYKNKKRFYTKNPQVGDQIFFGPVDDPYHTGLVIKVTSSKVYTIEGNTSGGSNVVANGGGVFEKSYPLNSGSIAGYGRPDYGDEATSTKTTTTTTTKTTLTVDGVWGVNTTKRAQAVFGVTVTGKVANQYKSYQASNPGLLTATFEFKEKPAKGGSPLIKAIQKKAGIKTSGQDGYIGPTTIKAMQKWLKTSVDGKVSKPSSMVKAFQKWLNAQK